MQIRLGLLICRDLERIFLLDEVSVLGSDETVGIGHIIWVSGLGHMMETSTLIPVILSRSIDE